MPTPVAGLPVGNTSVNGPDITVSRLLKSPRLIERRIGEVADLRYFINLILPNLGGDMGSGVIVYEEWDPRYSQMDRKPEPLAPDAEVPLANTAEGDVKMVRAEVDGLGYSVTREQENRNQRFVIDRKELALANSIADKFNARGVKALKDAIAASARTFGATDWSAIVTKGNAPTVSANWPHATLQLVKARQSAARTPFAYDGMLAHPLDIWRLGVIYDVVGSDAIRAKLNLNTLIEDNTGDVPHGQPILFSSGNVGGTVWEEPITTEVIPEPRRRRKVVQTTGSAGYFVDNPTGVLQLTGTAAADIAAGVN